MKNFAFSSLLKELNNYLFYFHMLQLNWNMWLSAAKKIKPTEQNCLQLTKNIQTVGIISLTLYLIKCTQCWILFLNRIATKFWEVCSRSSQLGKIYIEVGYLVLEKSLCNYLDFQKIVGEINTFKYHVSCIDRKISVRIKLELPFSPSSHSTIVFFPVGLSTLSRHFETGTVNSPSQEAEETSTPNKTC